ncbi:MAG: DUF4838 domain-containing protein [Armatimonadota bacterium]|nr:DUF4838 domain-containing protein [Armatimonadota bacterium]
MSINLRFLAFVLTFSVAVSASASTATLVKNGKSGYTIVLATEASPSEKHAASELQKFIADISGARLPVVGEADKPEKMIVVGSCETQRALAPDLNTKALGDEGFAIRTVGPHLLIAGGRLRGTMYGVYTFLEEVLGCRWYTSTVSRIPKKRTIHLASLNITQKPDFEYREPFYMDSWDADWSARNKANGNQHKLDETRGGKMSYIGFCHTFDALVPMDKYYKDHPEYYSLIDGARVGGQYQGQLCLTNPDVLKIVTDRVLQLISENPNSRIVSVSQNDNSGYCRCDKCKAVDEEEGSQSGSVLRFVNAVADEVGKQHPEMMIDTFAYIYTERPPKITRPRPNVRIRLCPVFNCQHHPYEKCENDKAFVENLRGWSRIAANGIYIWHYNTNFANYLAPLPDLQELAVDIPLYKRSGVVGIFFEGTYTAGNGPYGSGGFMDDLKAYLIAKLSWNTKADPRTIRDDFLSGYFGKAGKPIGEYLDLLEEKVARENIHGTVFPGIDKIDFLTEDVMTKSNELFDRAEKLAATPDELRRVKHARLSIRIVEVYRESTKAAAGSTKDRRAALGNLVRFVRDCKADGIVNISEGGLIDPWFEALAAPLRK